jgi:homoserine kinase
MPAAVRVTVPATAANLGPGFDAMGLAVDICNVAEFTLVGQDVRVEVTGVGAGSLPADETNLVAQTFGECLRRLGASRPAGVRIRCENRIPQSGGLGSSAAAVVQGAAAACAVAGRGDDPAEIFALAAALEGHPDNAAPAVFGGATIAYRAGESQQPGRPIPTAVVGTAVRIARLPVLPEIVCAVLVPDFAVPTAAARAAQPGQVPLADAIFNATRTALLTRALTAEPGLLFEATADRLHQPYRAGLMPPTARMVRSLRTAGFAAFVAGAGPTAMVLFPAERRAALQGAIARTADDTWQVLFPAVRNQGAIVESRL